MYPNKPKGSLMTDYEYIEAERRLADYEAQMRACREYSQRKKERKAKRDACINKIKQTIRQLFSS